MAAAVCKWWCGEQRGSDGNVAVAICGNVRRWQVVQAVCGATRR
ncbi:hypothetical protein OAN61_00885 [bacterium]|nr:hypothetical protein [bacterium]